MENIRTDSHLKKPVGIALITTLVITVVIMMLITGLTYLFYRGLGAVTLNREFSTVYDAAGGGVEYATGIIISYLSDPTNPPQNIGQVSGDLGNIITTCAQGESTMDLKTADGRYIINLRISCLGTQRLPGEGGALRFPPPRAKGGTGPAKATSYSFYSIIATARESENPQNIARVEAVYRTLQ